MNGPTATPGSFADRLSGPFDGMVRFKDAQILAATLANLGDWYVWQPAQEFLVETVQGGRAQELMTSLLDEIMQEERGVWTTMVYVQSVEDPWIVKIFHPRRAGCGCGGGGGIVPWWIFSRIPPQPVPEWNPVACSLPPTEKSPWWKNLF